MPTIPRVEKRRLLLQASPFQALDPSDLDGLIERLHERRFGDGELIFVRGDPGASLFVVAAGQVRLSLAAADGREVLLAIVGPGQLFGELAFLDGQGRSADAAAQGACVLLSLEGRHLLSVLQRSPEAALRFLELVCARTRAATSRIEAACFLSVQARLARLLLAEAGSARIAEPPSQSDIGRLIGASRQKVNLHLSRLLSEGILAREGRTLVIKNEAQLARLAEGESSDGKAGLLSPE